MTATQEPGPDPGPGDGVGLVVVSHSHALAQAAVALAAEMLPGGPVRIEVAAGLDETTFGTDAVSIQEAIERADGPAGVVVLMDLGSAVLSAELALDLIADPAVRDRVTLCPAPMVEGLVVAAVTASGGATREQVVQEASEALLAKSAQLAPGGDVPAAPEPSPATSVDGEVVGVLAIDVAHGLHARPAARLVAAVSGLDATVSLRNLTTGSGPVPARSLSRVATLAARHGHQVEIRASGPQAQEALDRLLALAARDFDETAPAGDVADAADDAAPRPAAAPRGPLPAAGGVAIGPVRHLASAAIELDGPPAGPPDVEWRRLLESRAAVRRDIEDLRRRTSREVGDAESGIFDAHLLLLDDADILDDVRTRIDGGAVATRAWAERLAQVEDEWAALPDPYLRERAHDVRAVGDQVLRALTGATARVTTAEGVLVARDLTPAEAAALDTALVTGVVLAQGSPSAHVAILARARDIPMVVAAGPGVLAVAEGTTVVLDGGTGELHVDPPPEVLEAFRRRAADAVERRARELAVADQPATTRDGTVVTVAANLGSLADARVAFAGGADAAGLVRTEFLFLGRESAPTLDEQRADYAAIAAAMPGRRITLRTLDVGGDKPLPYLSMPEEANPFLGRRGIRLSLEHRDLLRDQLVAICETARRGPVSVMFPMVSSLTELLAAREVLAEAAGEPGPPAGLQVGVMVEVPAAALKIETIAPHVDFVSIGTNDLTQYTLAAERGNAAVAALSDALDPGVLRLIGEVCRAPAPLEVAVCGEAASDPLAIPVLVGLGVRELSVSPSAVARVKAAVRELDVARCATVAAAALRLAGAEEVRALVRESLGGGADVGPG
jgi:phosphoenolpyruvate-protein phosphotransferase/dihydroxyacetone kinase phosphotransfer subunit